MLIRSEKFYLFSFITCLILALATKAFRESYTGDSQLFIIALGSAPSFLYLFGLIAVVPLIRKNMTLTSFRKTAYFLTLGALTYEIDQAFSSRVFDVYDVVATLLALIIMLGLHRNEMPQTQQVN